MEETRSALTEKLESLKARMFETEGASVIRRIEEYASKKSE